MRRESSFCTILRITLFEDTSGTVYFFLNSALSGANGCLAHTVPYRSDLWASPPCSQLHTLRRTLYAVSFRLHRPSESYYRIFGPHLSESLFKAVLHYKLKKQKKENNKVSAQRDKTLVYSLWLDMRKSFDVVELPLRIAVELTMLIAVEFIVILLYAGRAPKLLHEIALHKLKLKFHKMFQSKASIHA